MAFLRPVFFSVSNSMQGKQWTTEEATRLHQLIDEGAALKAPDPGLDALVAAVADASVALEKAYDQVRATELRVTAARQAHAAADKRLQSFITTMIAERQLRSVLG